MMKKLIGSLCARRLLVGGGQRENDENVNSRPNCPLGEDDQLQEDKRCKLKGRNKSMWKWNISHNSTVQTWICETHVA